MGIETTRALQARRREAAARVERLIARANERNPISSVRRARIEDGARLARRRIKALAAAQQAVTALEVEIGQALVRVVDQGTSRNEAFELAGLRRHLGRRYVELASRAQRQVPRESSTTSMTDGAIRLGGRHLDPTGTHPGVTTPRREL